MNYNVIEKVRKLHLDNDYTIRVSKNENDIFTICYPGNLLKKPHLKPLLVGYDLFTNNVIKKISSDNTKYDDYICCNYARRIVVIADVMLECINRELTEDLLYSEEYPELMLTDLKNFLPVPEEIDNEEELEHVFVNMIAQNQMQQDVDNKIAEGYHTICQVISTGGI